MRLFQRFPDLKARLDRKAVLLALIVVLLVANVLALGSRPPTTVATGQGARPGSPGGTPADEASAAAATPEEQAASSKSAGRGAAKASKVSSGVAGVVQGVTGSTIRIGVENVTDYDDVLSALGASNPGPEEPDADPMPKVAEWVNANGGIAGRKVVLAFHETDYIHSASWSAEGESSCQAFADDLKVFAVIASDLGGEGFVECLAKRNIPILAPNGRYLDRTEISKSFLYSTYWFESIRLQVNYVEGLWQQGFFEPGAKIGLLRHDSPIYARMVNEGIKPALARHGLKVEKEIALSDVDNAGDIGRAAGGCGSAALQFKTPPAVTHVIFSDHNGTIIFVCGPQFESQQYFPRYGMHSGQQPQWMRANVPATQFHRALGVGWWPLEDVASNEGLEDKPTYKTCRSIYKSMGFSDLASLTRCDQLLFLKLALGPTGAVTPAGLQAGVEGLGKNWLSTVTHSTRFEPGRHFGPDSYRGFAFDDGCACWKYATPPRPSL